MAAASLLLVLVVAMAIAVVAAVSEVAFVVAVEREKMMWPVLMHDEVALLDLSWYDYWDLAQVWSCCESHLLSQVLADYLGHGIAKRVAYSMEAPAPTAHYARGRRNVEFAAMLVNDNPVLVPE